MTRPAPQWAGAGEPSPAAGKPGGTHAPGVTVIMPVRNAEDLVGDALRSILDQTYGGRIEIVIADGSTNDRTARLVTEAFPSVRIVENPDGGTAAGLNRAIAAATHPIIVRCDARTRFPPGYVERAVATLLGTGAANVGGRQRPVGTTSFERGLAIATTTPLGTGNSTWRTGGVAGPTDTVYLGTFERTTLTEVDAFDEHQVTSQDYELNCRLRALGRTVWFDPGLVADYQPRSDLRSVARQYFAYGKGKRRTLTIHPWAFQMRQALPVALWLALATGIVTGIGAALAGWNANGEAQELALRIAMLASTPFVVYGLALGAGTMHALKSHRTLAALWLPAILATMHLCWATGFILPPAKRPTTRAGAGQ